MEPNGTTDDDSAQVSNISIDLLDSVDRADGTKATVSIPHGTAQTVQATVEPAEGGRWRCDFHVDPNSAAVSQALEEEPVIHVGEIPEWVAPVLSIIETLVTEAGC